MSEAQAPHPSPDREARAPHPSRNLVGWSLLAILLVYVVTVHYGIGPEPRGGARHWFQPRGFFYDWDLFTPLLDSVVLAMLSLGAVGLALACAVAIATRSSLAAALASACFVASVLFAFYGVQASAVWDFFEWRGSAVIGVTALVVGSALAAPLLAVAWLRRSWPLRLVLYLPIVLGVIAFMRNATGTDPSLKYSISPWPAVPVFGIELGAAFIAIVFAGAAVTLSLWARARQRSGAMAVTIALVGLAAALALPAGLLRLGDGADLLPFSVGTVTLWGAGAAAALVAAGTAAASLRDGRLASRARWLAVGTALVAIPLLAGHALSFSDYRRTRDARAGTIIDGLQTYYEREQLYPDTLDELVTSDVLGEIPEPSIGFGFLYDADFEYQNFGTGYVLEFQAPRWMQCAYNPPWQDEDDEQDVAAGPGDAVSESDESLGGAWSCPSEPPKLW